MRCRGASLQFMMAGSKSYIPTGIFSKARLHIFKRNSIPIVISGDGTSLKILLIPMNSKKVQRDAIYRKMESSKLSQSKKKFEVNKYSKIHKFQPPPSHSPPPTLRTYYSFVILRSKSNKSPRLFTKTRFQI